MKNLFLKYSLVLIFVFSNWPLYAQSTEPQNIECFSILAGKKATADGAVLFAHNEDDAKENPVHWYKVPRLLHKRSETIRLKNGGQIAQAKQTYAFFWLEMSGLQFSDSYMNEWGVTISSDQCLSREDKGELVDGGIGYYLRRIMAERAKSAKEAVKIAGKIIEQVGYLYSGRSYCIADTREAWMMAVVKGKHWLAQRVPDDQVAVIPNYYTITEIDLQDTLNFLGSKDIVGYAIKRGWYDPSQNKPFNFRQAYAARRTLKAIWNVPRHLQAVNMLSEKQYHYRQKLPFSFKPKKKLLPADLMAVLKNHYEGSQFEMNPGYNHGNPHESVISRICSNTNKYGFVAQLRSGMPVDVGALLWLAPRRPCIQPFIPWYSGITKIPPAYTAGDYIKAQAGHFNFDEKSYEKESALAFWAFSDLADKTDKDYGRQSGSLRKEKADFESRLFNAQAAFEQKVQKEYQKNPAQARTLLTDYTAKAAAKALQNTGKRLK